MATTKYSVSIKVVVDIEVDVSDAEYLKYLKENYDPSATIEDGEDFRVEAAANKAISLLSEVPNSDSEIEDVDVYTL